VSEGELHPDEVLYRRLSPNSNPARFDQDGHPQVYFGDFRPGPADFDGLSLIRASYRPAQVAAYSKQFPETRYLLAEIRAGDLQANGLTIKPSPDEIDLESDGPPAHAVVLELNTDDYRGLGRAAIKQLAMTVAQKCVHRIIGPFDPPDDKKSV
jgi:hypothetical protein